MISSKPLGHKSYGSIGHLPGSRMDINHAKDGTGKKVGKDAEKGKANYVTLLGADAARERLTLLSEQTKAHLDPFGRRADFLRASVDFVLDRRN